MNEGGRGGTWLPWLELAARKDNVSPGRARSSRTGESMGPNVHWLIPRYRRLNGEEKLNYDDRGLYTNDGHNPDVNPDVITPLPPLKRNHNPKTVRAEDIEIGEQDTNELESETKRRRSENHEQDYQFKTEWHRTKNKIIEINRNNEIELRSETTQKRDWN